MTPQELRARLDRFADQVITFCRHENTDPLKLRILLQLQDAGTSVAANYRAACRAQSKAAFIAKLTIALEEADEAQGWLQRLECQSPRDPEMAARLLDEANQITAILNASRETARGRRRR